MSEEQFWLLVSLKLSGEATPEELALLDSEISQSPEKRFKADLLVQIWLEKEKSVQLYEKDNYNRHLQRLSNHLADPQLRYEVGETGSIAVRRRSTFLKWGIGIAAAVAIVFVILFAVTTKDNLYKTSTSKNVVSTKRGSKSRIQLPDGSIVFLNADSRIVYDENFSGVLREVTLFGEAYFDVAQDKNHPFVIHAGGLDIKVLGTTFNVRSYADEKNTETCLITGAVEITIRNNSDKKIILKPNEKLLVKNSISPSSGNTGAVTYEEEEPMMILSKIQFHSSDSSSVIETQWTRNTLAFEGERLEDVARKIERWYDVRVVIADESLKNNTYSGIFEDETLSQVIRALQLTGGFKYSIDKKEVIIKK
ncbi:MAG: DUF4974 domain-containing protein [Chitinophagaceae bacterium]|nr:DUF4974 domain-containing protein [Chitinophagaceae bacterium]